MLTIDYTIEPGNKLIGTETKHMHLPVLGGLDGTGLESTESAVMMNDGCCVLVLLEGDGAIIPFAESENSEKKGNNKRNILRFSCSCCFCIIGWQLLLVA